MSEAPAREAVRLLGFVNHIPPGDGVEDAIEQALEWGVDYIVAQGTGSDWGPYWLGSGEALAVDVGNNVRPYLRAAVAHSIPFLFSFGIAGANVHLEHSLAAFERVCAEEGWRFRLGILESEIDPARLAALIEDGRDVVRGQDVDDLRPRLDADGARRLTRAVGLVGPEPLVDLLRGGVDGVITGRALDIALFMAPLLANGFDRAVAGHAGKLMECAGLALDPGDSAQAIWGEVTGDGIVVRSPNPRYRTTVRSLASHSFYERSDPSKEDNPGGRLDLSDAAYEVLGDGGVRCTGARWIDAPYTVLVEGAELAGHRSIVIMGARDPQLLSELDAWEEQMRRDVASAARFAELRPGEDYTITLRVYGRDAVLGALEPEAQALGHEVGAILDVVARDEQLASELAYFAFIRLFIAPYPGRKTTAGNVAVPYMPLVIPTGPVFTFGSYHLLPLERPDEVFRSYELEVPRAGAA